MWAGPDLHKKTPVYPDMQGGLTGFTNLGPLLPDHKYERIATGRMCAFKYSGDAGLDMLLHRD